jgi:4-hydroxy-tetrahydrodipicolinate synthase
MTRTADQGGEPMSRGLTGDTRGVFIIAATPFTETGEIDWPSVDSLVEFYLDNGVHGITILGMMGEAQKLSDTEAEAFTGYLLRRVAGRVPVIVGVSNPGLDNLVRLARVSMEHGACGVMVAPITGLKTEGDILNYFGTAIDRLGPEIPVCYQDYPYSTGVNISAATFGTLVEKYPSLVMFKHEDWPGLRKLSQIRRMFDGSAGRRISILCGNGGLYLPQELRRGADGAMTGFAYPEMLVQVWEAFAAGRADEAEDLFDVYLPLVRHELQPGIGLAIRKEILKRRGAIRSAAVRAPGPRLDADDRRELDELLSRLARTLAQRA